MRKSFHRCIALPIPVVVALTDCETIEANPKTVYGAMGGATVGGLIAGAAHAKAAAVAVSVRLAGILVGMRNSDCGIGVERRIPRPGNQAPR